MLKTAWEMVVREFGVARWSGRATVENCEMTSKSTAENEGSAQTGGNQCISLHTCVIFHAVLCGPRIGAEKLHIRVLSGCGSWR